MIVDKNMFNNVRYIHEKNKPKEITVFIDLERKIKQVDAVKNISNLTVNEYNAKINEYNTKSLSPPSEDINTLDHLRFSKFKDLFISLVYSACQDISQVSDNSISFNIITDVNAMLRHK